ncbi:MAG: ATP phosphoribosyltransferase [Neisseriaceae bacterium]|jgi:ATP phosphoribosyltransferase|nr:MAG: ATP phosphoribosyltransferase [Neisseriaceae bacterium]
MSDCKLKVALQKSGKLSEGSFELLNKCSFKLRPSKNHYLIETKELNSSFLLIRDDDIPGFVDSEVSDIGIVGENGVFEYILDNPKHNLEVITKLGFAHCRLSIAVPQDGQIKSIQDLHGKTIATSYPASLRDFLAKHNVQAKILVMHGSVELAPKIAIADAICDLVSTGATLKENKLVELEVIFESEAVIIGNKNCSAEVKEKINELIFRLQSVIEAKDSKYIMLHIDKSQVGKLQEILPGCESPTVLYLHGSEDKVAVHVVSKEGIFWDTISKLKSIGATSILVLPIEKMMS